MRYGFIGCGTMGGAIAQQLSESTKDIMLSDLNMSRAAFLASELGVKKGTNEGVISESDVVFLGIKPQMAKDVLTPLIDLIHFHHPVIISMLAGVEISKLESIIGGNIGIIRIMPNTPVAVGKGVIMYCRNGNVQDDVLDEILEDMRPCGMLDQIPEQLIDAGCALSSCGPAFVYMFLDALASGGVACGIPRDKAVRYAAMTMIGAAEMLISTGKHPEQLKDEVCTPAGSTIKGVQALEASGFRSAAMSCISTSYKATQNLGK